MATNRYGPARGPVLTALDRAERLFNEFAQISADAPGVTRASYSPTENAAHDIIRREAKALGLEQRTDAIGNHYVTLAGRNREAPVLMIGSHLDSVPHGGNFDGAAGVLAGLVLLERMADGPQPSCDVTLMVIRAEEMIWFPEHYLGSRAAFGLLAPDTPDRVCRSDSGRSLADHMTEAGFNPQVIRDGKAQLDPTKIRAFVEVHIEQGPVLVEANHPIGIVTSIRGNIRYRFAEIKGETGHAGGLPRKSRRDAVLAGAELIAALELWWHDAEEKGKDMVLTFGEFYTHPARHGITKVPGLVRFTLDVRSQDDALLTEFDAYLANTISKIETKRGVEVTLGASTRAKAAPMADDLQDGLSAAAQAIGVPTIPIPSGGGHDCATFANLGIASAMLFVRNENGSHNPNEHMDFKDFSMACNVLTSWCVAEVGTF